MRTSLGFSDNSERRTMPLRNPAKTAFSPGDDSTKVARLITNQKNHEHPSRHDNIQFC